MIKKIGIVAGLIGVLILNSGGGSFAQKDQPDMELVDGDIQNYLNVDGNTYINNGRYQIIERYTSDFSTEGGDITAVFFENNLNYVRLSMANSINTIEYKYSFFDNYFICSKVQVEFGPADTAKDFGADNFVYREVSQSTWLCSAEETIELGNSPMELPGELPCEDLWELLQTALNEIKTDV